ncbi:polyhydroxyalkanoic acid system family protein [Aureimonas frigidaquae]|uniref:polyhydroxyalkanoic acid system family protein n=1 Tax=Aureimonas frigidaquae TaxID=424757 RepID=UPI00078066E9|nr:polyhydroxyalkanoic acid system family protein [Aureimonas frigidaquae]
MAETVKLDIPHKLSRDAARQRIIGGFDRIRSDATGGMIKFEDVWTGDHLDFRARMMGQAINGRLDVLDDHVHVEIDLPMFLAALADKVKGRITKEATVLLEHKP